MKKILTIFLLIFFTVSMNAQDVPPQGITYQAVALDDKGMEISGMDAAGLPIPEKAIKVRFTILKNSASGPEEYSEEHTTNTDKYGLFSLIIGGGTPTSTTFFSGIKWEEGKKFLKVELSIHNDNNYKLVSVQQMMSVPYALFAGKTLQGTNVENARFRDSVDFSNKLNTLQGNLNNHLTADQDLSPANELQTLSKNKDTIKLSNGGGTVMDSDNQQLSLSNGKGTISLSNGGKIILPDSSDLNELQTLSKFGNTFILSHGGGTAVDRDNQEMTMTRTKGSIFLSDGGFVVLADSSATNEIQTLSINNDTLFLSQGGKITLPASSKSWRTFGNNNTIDGTDFIGTSDNVPLNFRIHNRRAGRIDSTGKNTFLGFKAMNSNTGKSNTAMGFMAGFNNTSGTGNVAIGDSALFSNTTGNFNTRIGHLAFNSGENNWNNSGMFGYAALNPGGSNTYRFGNSSVGSIGGQVSWTTISDARTKENIRENVPGIDFILKLRPVTYNYNLKKENVLMNAASDTQNWEGKYNIEKMRFSGFLAQEVDSVARTIGYDFSGVDKPKTTNGVYGIRYSEFVVPMVKAMQEQQLMIEELRKQNALLLKRIEKLESPH